MRLQDLNPKFGKPRADPATVLLERLRQRAERESIRWLTQWRYHADAQDLLAELEVELAGREAKIADLEARAALSSKEAAEARKRHEVANLRVHSNPITPKEKGQALRARQEALDQQGAAEAAARKALRELAELRRPLPSMVSFQRALQTVQPPDISALPGLAALMSQVQDDPPARRWGRKKRGG